MNNKIQESLKGVNMVRINETEWLETISKTRLYKLAERNLIRKNKVKKEVHGNTVFYEFDPVDVLIEGLLIRRKADKARIRI